MSDWKRWMVDWGWSRKRVRKVREIRRKKMRSRRNTMVEMMPEGKS